MNSNYWDWFVLSNFIIKYENKHINKNIEASSNKRQKIE